MIWVELAFRRECQEHKLEAAFDRVPVADEEIEVGPLTFRVTGVCWTIRLDENENPIGQAQPYVTAKFVAERTEA